MFFLLGDRTFGSHTFATGIDHVILRTSDKDVLRISIQASFLNAICFSRSPYCVPSPGDGNTNATTVCESTALPFLFAGLNPHVFTAVIADPVNAATPCTTFTLLTSPPLPTLTSNTTVPNAVVFDGYVAYVADATCAGIYGAPPTSAAGPNPGLGKPTPAGLKGLNTTVTRMLDATPLPFNMPAANDHPCTAVCAALVNGGKSLTTCTFWIFAFPSRFTCSVTIPGELLFTG